jgi:acetolactate synthase-1/2/3 large subunit
MFKEYGARYMFGMVGGQHYPIYVGISELSPDIQHVGFRCEKCAAFAAYAYALVTGRPGLCDGTVGPGATNMVSGVAEAWAASVPLIAVSGDVPTSDVGKWAAQECDMTGIMRPFTKKVLRVERPDKVPESVRAAFRIATTGRPGPVHMIFPADVLAADCDFRDSLYIEPECGVYPARRPAPDPAAIARATDAILAADKPVLFAGGGVLSSGASQELVELAELLCAPVATSMMGKGSIPEDHPLSVGAAVTFYTPEAVYQLRGHRLMAETDLAIFVGTRTDEAATAKWRMPPPGTPCVHLDIDPHEIGRNYPVVAGLVTDAKLGLRALAESLRSHIQSRPLEAQARYNEIRQAVAGWRQVVSPKLNSSEVPVTGHRVVREIQSVLDPEGILVTDASLVPYYSAGFFDVGRAGRAFISPRGLGSLGAGLPFTIGAKLAAPERPVIGIGGDGGFAMSLHELETMKRAKVNAVFVVLNNACLGYGVMTLEPAVSLHFEPVAYAKAAEAFGCFGIRVERPEELGDALRVALAADCPAVVEVIAATEMPTSEGAALLDRVADNTVG